MKLSYVAADSKPCKYGNVMDKITAFSCKKAIQKIVTIMTSMMASIGLTNLCIKQIATLLNKPLPANVIEVGIELFSVGFELISSTSKFLLMLIFIASVLKTISGHGDTKDMLKVAGGVCLGYTIIVFAPTLVSLIMNLLILLFI